MNLLSANLETAKREIELLPYLSRSGCKQNLVEMSFSEDSVRETCIYLQLIVIRIVSVRLCRLAGDDQISADLHCEQRIPVGSNHEWFARKSSDFLR